MSERKSEPTAVIKLKADYTKPREVSVGNKTVKARPGDYIEVPLKDLQVWLGTGRFDHVERPVSDLPEKLPGRNALVKNGITFDQLRTMDGEALTALPGIKAKTSEEILKFLEDFQVEGEQN